MGGAKKRMRSSIRFGWAWLAGSRRIANCAKLAAGSMKSGMAQPPSSKSGGAKAPPAPLVYPPLAFCVHVADCVLSYRCIYYVVSFFAACSIAPAASELVIKSV